MNQNGFNLLFINSVGGGIIVQLISNNQMLYLMTMDLLFPRPLNDNTE